MLIPIADVPRWYAERKPSDTIAVSHGADTLTWAQLERNADGLKMGELSRRLMVTGGNVTGITDQLVAEGLVRREPIAGDRRAYAVQLTPKGKRAFDTMAAEHERWVEELLSGLTRAERERLYTLLGRLKTTIRERDAEPALREGRA